MLETIETYVRDRVRRGELASSSAEQARWMMRAWVRHAEEPPWTAEQVADWALDDRLRANTRKSRLSQLRAFVKWLMIEDMLETDPTLRLGRVRVPSGAPRDLTVQEVGALYEACGDDRMRLVVLLMAHMGLRVGDVTRIRVEDVDVSRRSLHVRAKGGRGEPTHWEPIPCEVWPDVHTAMVGTSGPLVRSLRGGAAITPNHLGRLVRKAMTDAGLKDRPWDGRSSHSLRHSCAQHMLDGGAELRQVQYTLGHRTIRSTEGYVRREPPGLRQAMEGRHYRDAA